MKWTVGGGGRKSVVFWLATASVVSAVLTLSWVVPLSVTVALLIAAVVTAATGWIQQ